MLARFKKVRSGDGAGGIGVALTFVRDDASVDVQRSGHGGFFAMHDLMHYAVETTLDIRDAFFGLVHSGWPLEAFSDHAHPLYRTLPTSAVVVEHLVAALSRAFEPGLGADADVLALSAEEVNAELTSTLGAARLPERSLSVPEVGAIFERFESLSRRWTDLEIGGSVEVEFPLPGAARRPVSRRPGS
ncbi:MAG: hypothetical protein AB7G11_07160 [Phycisphaerales bacterium]